MLLDALGSVYQPIIFVYFCARLFFNHILFRRLVVARAKKLWGLHLKKYALTLPGGGSINGSEIYSDGVAEEEKAFEAVQKEAAPAMFCVG